MGKIENRGISLGEISSSSEELIFFEKVMTGVVPWSSLTNEQQKEILLLMIDVAMENPKNKEFLKSINDN